MRLLLVFLFLLAWCGLANAAGPWTLEQPQLGAVLAAATIVDYGQTMTIARSNGYWREYNPLLGHNPSPSRVNIYFAVVPLLGYVALDLLPSDARTVALKIIAVTELGFVGRNAYLGIGIRY